MVGNPGQANYSASKAGLMAMTRSLATEIASRNVTVNCVAPGFTASAMTDVLNEKQKAMIMERVPVRRLGTPAEVAGAVVYLASDEAAYVTGQTIHVNGGIGHDMTGKFHSRPAVSGAGEDRPGAAGKGPESMLLGSAMPLPATSFFRRLSRPNCTDFPGHFPSGFVQEPLNDRLRGASSFGMITS